MKTKVNKKNIVITFLALFLAVLAIISFVSYELFVGKEYIKYNENNNLDYAVCFNQPNDFYESECASKDINNYVSKYINYINVNFDYELNFDKEVVSSYNYYIVGELTIYDRSNNASIMNKKDYPLVEIKKLTNEGKEIKLAESVKIDYKIYNTYVTQYKLNSNVQAGANLKVVLYVESSNKHNEISKNINAVREIAINIPLDETTIQLSQDFLKQYESPEIEIDTKETDINKLFLISTWLFGISSAILFGILIILASIKHNKLPVYKRFIEELKHDYDSDITDITSLIDNEHGYTYEYFDVASFKELFHEIQNSRKKINWNEKKYYDKDGNILNRISWFFIFMDEDSRKVKRFIVDENKLTKEYKKNPNIIKKYRG